MEAGASYLVQHRGWEGYFMPMRQKLDAPASDLERAADRLLQLLEQSDPTGLPQRHPEWPLKIVADEDMAIQLVGALKDLEMALMENED